MSYKANTQIVLLWDNATTIVGHNTNNKLTATPRTSTGL